jgi:hypothetical protein
MLNLATDTITFYTAVFAAAVVAKLTDPVGWLQIAMAFLMGLGRTRLWAPLLLAAAFTSFTIAALYVGWVNAGIQWWPRGAVLISIGYFATAYMAYGIGYLLTSVFSPSRRTQD